MSRWPFWDILQLRFAHVGCRGRSGHVAVPHERLAQRASSKRPPPSVCSWDDHTSLKMEAIAYKYPLEYNYALIYVVVPPRIRSRESVLIRSFSDPITNTQDVGSSPRFMRTMSQGIKGVQCSRLVAETPWSTPSIVAYLELIYCRSTFTISAILPFL
jgi:hypothetical protein